MYLVFYLNTSFWVFDLTLPLSCRCLSNTRISSAAPPSLTAITQWSPGRTTPACLSGTWKRPHVTHVWGSFQVSWPACVWVWSVLVWNLEKGDVELQLHGHTGHVTTVSLTADGSTVISGMFFLTIFVIWTQLLHRAWSRTAFSQYVFAKIATISPILQWSYPHILYARCST